LNRCQNLAWITFCPYTNNFRWSEQLLALQGFLYGPSEVTSFTCHVFFFLAKCEVTDIFEGDNFLELYTPDQEILYLTLHCCRVGLNLRDALCVGVFLVNPRLPVFLSLVEHCEHLLFLLIESCKKLILRTDQASIFVELRVAILLDLGSHLINNG